MSIGLSAAELTKLQAALTILLSPLDCESIGEWRTNGRHAVQSLLGADSSVSLLQIPGEPPFDADDVHPLLEYGAYYHRFDRVDKYRDLGTVAFTWDTIGHLWERPSRQAWLASAFYNEWVTRNHLCQPRGMNVALPSGQPLTGPSQGQDVAALYCYQDAERPAIDTEHQLVILRTLLPAFTAGAYVALRAGTRGTLEHLAGTLSEGVELFDARGAVAYRNRAFEELLSDDPDRAAIERDCGATACFLLALRAPPGAKSRPERFHRPGARLLRTATAAYHLRGVLVAAGVLGLGPAALVIVERTTPGPRSLETFRTHFNLTPRELMVARLLADGRSNHELALRLGVSIHTVRRHVEHVLMKLGVHSRAAVGARLRETA